MHCGWFTTFHGSNYKKKAFNNLLDYPFCILLYSTHSFSILRLLWLFAFWLNWFFFAFYTLASIFLLTTAFMNFKKSFLLNIYCIYYNFLFLLDLVKLTALFWFCISNWIHLRIFTAINKCVKCVSVTFRNILCLTRLAVENRCTDTFKEEFPFFQFFDSPI
jgi:hypothetical protein